MINTEIQGELDEKDKNDFKDWGCYMALKKRKLQHQFEAKKDCCLNVKESEIFKNIAVFVNGYTDPSAEIIRELMLKHSGTYHHYYHRNETTHIIASNLPYAKRNLFRQKKVVVPSWITDSINAGYLLDFRKYLLNTLINQNGQKLISFQTTKESCSKSIDYEITHKEKINKSSSFIKDARDSNFLFQFFSRSRLHLISSLAIELKEHIHKLCSESPEYCPGQEQICQWKVEMGLTDCIEINPAERIILHIDMDCFFVSVGLRNKPELYGHPVAVAHADVYSSNCQSSTSEISSCSYEARIKGVRSRMFLKDALNICPDLITIPYNFESYKEVSFILYNIVSSLIHHIQAVSCDELYIDCTKILSKVLLHPLNFAEYLRSLIKKQTQCNASIGIGPNMLTARIATRHAKPNGVFQIQSSELQKFMENENISNLPGIGYNFINQLNQLGINTCGQLQNLPMSILEKHFGSKVAAALIKHSQGKDERPVTPHFSRKSVSVEVNYGIRFYHLDEIKDFISKLCLELQSRLQHVSLKARTITLKIMLRSAGAPVKPTKYMGHGQCDILTKSVQMIQPTNNCNEICKKVLYLFNKFSIIPNDLRGIGIHAKHLQKAAVIHNSLSLFLEQKKNEKKETNNFAFNAHILSSAINQEENQQKNIDPPSHDFDIKIWNELPRELQLQLIKEYSLASFSSMDKKCDGENKDIYNISFSQIDPSFLEALPDDVKAELKDDLNSLRNATQINHKTTVAKSCSKSPVFKSKCNAKVSKQKSTLNTLPSIINKLNHNSLTPVNVVYNFKTEKKNPKLCDASSLKEIKELLEEWLTSSVVPITEDVKIFSNYIGSLLDIPNLEMVYQVMLHFYRLTKDYIDWQLTYKQILKIVQTRVQRDFGAPLSLPS